MAKKKILAIVGSLRRQSYNRQLAEAAGRILGGRADFEILEYADLPYMNQDIEFPAPEAVARVRQAVLEADGLWFFTPEYNHAVPGVLKNLIDWLSRPQGGGKGNVLAGKACAISGASMGQSGAMVAQDFLALLLSVLNMDLMHQPKTAIARVHEQADKGVLKLEESQEYLEKQADAFMAFLEKRA